MNIELNDQEVQALLDVLMNATGAPWRLTHPLIMKLGAQQQAALARGQLLQEAVSPPQRKGNAHGTADLDQERRAAGDVGSAGRDTFHTGLAC